jgi:ABC-2 type transport system ATP-binding protein
LIEVVNATKKFGDFTAVDDISFSIKTGELFALLGPNGAGKSTTIKMLTTLLRPTAGKLSLNGHDVVKNQSAARKSFGIVFQDPSVDTELTAYENMEIHAIMYGVSKRELPGRITLGSTRQLGTNLFRRYEATSRDCSRLIAPS